MVAPNPTKKQMLKNTYWTHIHLTCNNIPGSIPAITCAITSCLIMMTLANHLWQSPQHSTPVNEIPWRAPKVWLIPIPDRLCESNLVIQDAINFLTDCVWAKAPDIYTPNKLKPKHQGLNLEQVTMPMVHPTTGETISSYKKLMHDPATSEIWQTAFGNNFGGMAQGNNKTGQKGTDSIFVMTRAEIPCISKNQTVTYSCMVVDFRPQKADPHWILITASGNSINYPGKLSTRTANLTTSKLMWNSILSTDGTKYMCLDIMNFYLSAPLDRLEAKASCHIVTMNVPTPPACGNTKRARYHSR